MESCSNQKVLNKSKYILYFRFFKVANLCLDDSFAHSWHSLNHQPLINKCIDNVVPTVTVRTYISQPEAMDYRQHPH